MKMHIRHGTLLALLLFPLLSLAQVTSGPLSLTGTGCVQVSVDAQAQVAMNISGSWSGTIQPEAAIAGQSAANVQVTPSTSSTAASTITASGLYTATVAGYQTFLLCGNTVTGTATVYFSTTQRSASGRSSGGGGGAGTVTSVLGTANQITSDGSTTTPTLSIPSTFTFPGSVTNDLSIFGATTSAQLRGVLSDESGTGAALFAGGNIGAATGTSLALTDTAANADLSVTNTTAATSGTSQSSPLFSIAGKYWTGAASGADSWTIQDVIGNGTNGQIDLTFTHAGSSSGGFARVSVPRLMVTGGIIDSGALIVLNSNTEIANGLYFSPATDVSLSRASAGLLQLGTTSANALGSLNLTNLTATGAVSAATYATATNCSNAASPAVCAAAASGVVAVPTGTNPTLTINTTSVTANSRIFLQIDESATIAATTCNTTLSTLVQPVVTARVVNTSLTIQIGAIIATNPACVSFFLVN